MSVYQLLVSVSLIVLGNPICLAHLKKPKRPHEQTMDHHDLILFFLQICVMLAAALVFGQVMRKLRQPVVIGELIGGIFLGPTVFGALAPEAYTWLFPTTGTTLMVREAVIKLGMLFFLFIAGLEVNVMHLRKLGLSVALTSIFGIMVPFGFGFGLTLLLPDMWEPHTSGNGLMFALFLGTALSISAVPVIAKILMDINLIKKELGVIIMTAAIIDDLVGWSLFAVIMSNFMADGRSLRNLWISLGVVLGLFVLILSVGRWAAQCGMRWVQSHMTSPSSFIGVIAILVLVAAATTEALGIHAIFGAFLVGTAMSKSFEERHHVHEVIYQFANNFFAPIYFVSLGLKTNFAANFDLTLVLLILLVANVGKICGTGFGAWISGMSLREALAVGFGMNARGAMEIILASVALEYALIDQEIFVALTAMALFTSMISGPMMQRLVNNRNYG